jgi:hypothetical protein
VLTVTAWITAAQRIYAVYRAARREHAGVARTVSETQTRGASIFGGRPTPRTSAKGE